MLQLSISCVNNPLQISDLLVVYLVVVVVAVGAAAVVAVDEQTTNLCWLGGGFHATGLCAARRNGPRKGRCANFHTFRSIFRGKCSLNCVLELISERRARVRLLILRHCLRKQRTR